MFKEIDIGLEKSILAGSERKTKGADFSIRTVTHWLTLPHHMSFCTVPSHYDNVPDTDYKGEKYDKYPTRMCITNGPYEVCRWCYVAEADVRAEKNGIPPTVREDGDSQ